MPLSSDVCHIVAGCWGKRPFLRLKTKSGSICKIEPLWYGGKRAGFPLIIANCLLRQRCQFRCLIGNDQRVDEFVEVSVHNGR